jgi:hypothetical protein
MSDIGASVVDRLAQSSLGRTTLIYVHGYLLPLNVFSQPGNTISGTGTPYTFGSPPAQHSPRLTPRFGAYFILFTVMIIYCCLESHDRHCNMHRTGWSTQFLGFGLPSALFPTGRAFRLIHFSLSFLSVYQNYTPGRTIGLLGITTA